MQVKLASMDLNSALKHNAFHLILPVKPHFEQNISPIIELDWKQNWERATSPDSDRPQTHLGSRSVCGNSLFDETKF